MPTPPAAVLFDADGVLQRPTIDWRSRLGALAGPVGTREEFILDVIAAEQPSLAGHGEFADALAEVLGRWQSTSTAQDALVLWSEFEAEPAVMETIRLLRAAGIGCHLATNQQAYRRDIMRERGYAAWFDREFYSCDLGLAKPDPAYFRAVLADLGLPPAAVLFVDDNEANVAAARSVGLLAERYELETGVDRLHSLLKRHHLPLPS